MKPSYLVLAAHGSTASANANQPLHQLAAALAERAEFDRVTPAFLDGTPEMTSVLESLPPGSVNVVPVMTSEGYYLKKLPEKFSANRNFDQFDFSISPVVGIHGSWPCTIARRIKHHLQNHGLISSETTVLLIGHGTRRNPKSGQTTIDLKESLALRLVDTDPELRFEVAFLDQEPQLVATVRQLTTPNVIVIPFLISRGPHVTEDVPAAFGLPTGPGVEFPMLGSSGRKCPDQREGIYLIDGPLATYPDMVDVVLEVATGVGV